jgi:type I restriction enzyme S subunit
MSINKWQTACLGDIAEVIDPHPSHRAPAEVKDGIPFTGIGDFYEDGSINFSSCRCVDAKVFEDHNARYEIKRGDIGFGRVASIGKVIRLREDLLPYVISPTLALIKPKGINPDYLIQFLKSFQLQEQIGSLLTGTTRSSLGIELLRNLTIVFPHLREQEKIAEVLSTIDRAIAQTEAIIAKQQRIKTGLMQDLLTKGIDENGNIRSEATHEFKDSAIGRIPVEWDSLKAKDVCLLITKGTTPKRRDTESDDYPIPFLRVQNITFDGVIDFSSDQEFISEEVHYKELFRSIIYPKDILQNIVGPPLGKICIVSSEYPEWNVNQAIAIFRPNQKITSNFLYYWLLSTKAKVWFEINSKRTSGQQNLTLEQCQDLPIALPSLSEQKQIHSIIGQISDLQSIQQQYLQKLNSQKTGLMQDLLTGKVRVTNLLNQKAAAKIN